VSSFNEVRARTKEIEVNPSLDGCKRLILSVVKLLDSSIDSNDLGLFELFTDDGRKLAANASWFLSDTKVKDHKATYQIYQDNSLNIDFKLFGVQNSSKRVISWSQALTPNFEDEPFYEDLRIGIDFIISKSFDRVQVALSSNYVIRILELHGDLTATFEAIFAKWEAIEDFSNKRFVHTLLWESFDLHPINKKFYEGIAERFVSLRQFLAENEILDENHASQFANRLIGRLVFCWFLRKKDFIDKSFDYFSSTNYADDTNYYREKLEVLFFDVLSKPLNERKSADLSTPYLNGGLFEDRADDLYQSKSLRFPSNYFDDFYAFLDSYNFTTDESTSQYQQVAIDPEMLGRIFENLLAEMSDEAGEQARKAKGAFYTPREIVDFMCRESLREYLRSALPADANLEQRLIQLIDGSDREFQDQDHNWRRDWKPYKENLIAALNDLRILDPACGSGAYPMGMLHLLMTVYERLDSALGKDVQKMKLQIISNNLFGVDIEPMAVEISRLRAWLSLVVDLEPSVKNVKPLPNLDFRFVCADSLIPLDTNGALMFGEDPELGNKLEEIRRKYFSTENLAKKKKYRSSYQGIINGEVSMFGESKRTTQLKSYQPFDTSATASFFDPSHMFGCHDFQIVIGNPPYKVLAGEDSREALENLKSVDSYKYALGGRLNLYRHFIERSIQLLTNRGVLSFIVPSTLIADKNTSGIRRMFRESGSLKFLIEFPEKEKVFESVTQATTVFLYHNSFEHQDFRLSVGLNSANLPPLNSVTLEWEAIETLFGKDLTLPMIKSPLELDLIRKIKSGSFPLSDITNCWEGEMNQTFKKKQISSTKTNHIFVRGEHLSSYFVDLKTENTDRRWFDLKETSDPSERERLGCQGVSNMGLRRRVMVAKIPKGVILGNSLNYIDIPKEYNADILLALLNSSLLNWFFRKQSTNNNVNVYELNALPIKRIDTNFEKSILDILELIEKLTKESDYKRDTSVTSALEALMAKIDRIIYTAYELNDEEVALVEDF
jgi:Alw26I/Eco31I/Esp3I family type II restriction m6 adenine DNA methyltransferase